MQPPGSKLVRELIDNDAAVMMYKSMHDMALAYFSVFLCANQSHMM